MIGHGTSIAISTVNRENHFLKNLTFNFRINLL